MITIDIRGLTDIQRKLRLFPDSLDIAKQRTVIKMAKLTLEAETNEMRRCFSNPTRFTLNAFKTTFNKAAITSTVEIKDGYWTRSQNYLETQRLGGKRKMKAFENALRAIGLLDAGWYAVPGEGAQMDAYGNMSVGQIRQILSWFDVAERVSGSTQNMGQKGRDKKRKGTKKQRGFEYFAAQPGVRSGFGSWKNGRVQTLTPGIYMRTSFGFGKAIKPVLIFVRDAAYKPRFRFDEVANKVKDKHLTNTADESVAIELRKLGL